MTGMAMTRKTVTDDISMLRRGEEGPDGQDAAVPNPRITAGGAGATAEIPARG